VYVSLVAALAVTGTVHGSATPYLAAIALTLPFGVSAAVCMYGGYAVLKGVGGLWAAPTRPGGDDAGWLGTGSAALDVTALVAAALANVLLAEHLTRRRAAVRAAGVSR
jgi:hypothetical protein